MSRQGGSRSRAVLVCLVLVSLGGAVVDIVLPPILDSLTSVIANTTLLLSANIVLNYGLTFAVALGFVLTTKRGLSYFDLRWPARWGYFYAIVGVLARLTTEVILSIADSVFGLASTGSGDVGEILAAETATAVIGVALLFIVAVPVEELFYRNTIQKRLEEAFSAKAAIGAAGILFALAHIPIYYDPAIVPMISPFGSNLAGGLIYGVIYYRTQNITPAILAHGLYNMIGVAASLL